MALVTLTLKYMDIIQQKIPKEPKKCNKNWNFLFWLPSGLCLVFTTFIGFLIYWKPSGPKSLVVWLKVISEPYNIQNPNQLIKAKEYLIV